MSIDYSRQIGKKITTKGDKKRVINVENIMYIKREGYLSTIFLNTGKEISDIKTLRAFEKELNDMGFFRIHNNTIVNGSYITEVDTRNYKRTVKLGEISLTVSKRRLKFFRDWIL
jgi:DNA-binding LytR/AlgR family response regulator